MKPGWWLPVMRSSASPTGTTATPCFDDFEDIAMINGPWLKTSTRWARKIGRSKYTMGAFFKNIWSDEYFGNDEEEYGNEGQS
jgi:hypothetical protein